PDQNPGPVRRVTGPHADAVGLALDARDALALSDVDAALLRLAQERVIEVLTAHDPKQVAAAANGLATSIRESNRVDPDRRDVDANPKEAEQPVGLPHDPAAAQLLARKGRRIDQQGASSQRRIALRELDRRR